MDASVASKGRVRPRSWMVDSASAVRAMPASLAVRSSSRSLTPAGRLRSTWSPADTPDTVSSGKCSLSAVVSRSLSGPVDSAGLADVALVVTAIEHPCEGKLLERWREVVEQLLGRCRFCDERFGQHQPAKPQSRSERLGDGAQVDDSLWVEAL